MIIGQNKYKFMKKLIILLITVLLSSCGYSPIDNTNPTIITKIRKYNDIYSYYYGKGSDEGILSLANVSFRIKDSTGKWNIGDTIKLNK